jgi:hypothetical protein
MEKEQAPIRIELTDEQKEQIKQASGKTVSTLEFTVAELEQRIAPVSLSYGSVHVTYTPQ